jgi:hypothetical protein
VGEMYEAEDKNNSSGRIEYRIAINNTIADF